MARITGKEAQGLMAAYARVHAPEIKEDVSEETLSEETSLEEESQDLSEEELQEILGMLRKAGNAIGSTYNRGKEIAGNLLQRGGNLLQRGKETVTDFRRGGISQVKQGNEARKDIAQTRDKLANQRAAAKSGSVDAQSGMGNDPGATRAQLAFKEKQRQKQLGTYQKPKTAQELARERIAAKNRQSGVSASDMMSGSAGSKLNNSQKNRTRRPVSSPMDMRGESYDQYDQIVDLLISEGYADNVKDAQFIMAQPEFIEGFNEEMESLHEIPIPTIRAGITLGKKVFGKKENPRKPGQSKFGKKQEKVKSPMDMRGDY